MSTGYLLAHAWESSETSYGHFLLKYQFLELIKSQFWVIFKTV